MNSKTKNTVVLILSILLGGFMIFSSIGKLSGGALENFKNWGYNATFMYIIGVLELLGGVGLIVKPLRLYAALGLIGLMLGAAYTHFNSAEYGGIGMNAGIILALVGIIVLSRK